MTKLENLNQFVFKRGLFKADMISTQVSTYPKAAYFLRSFQHIHESHENSRAEHVKFADYATVWESNKDPLVVVHTLCRKAKTWVDWCRKWKMSVNFTKPEGTVFFI